MKQKRKPTSGPKFIPCGRCDGGLIRVPRGSGYVMRQCQCMSAWKGLKAPEKLIEKDKRYGDD